MHSVKLCVHSLAFVTYDLVGKAPQDVLLLPASVQWTMHQLTTRLPAYLSICIVQHRLQLHVCVNPFTAALIGVCCDGVLCPPVGLHGRVQIIVAKRTDVFKIRVTREASIQHLVDNLQGNITIMVTQGYARLGNGTLAAATVVVAFPALML